MNIPSGDARMMPLANNDYMHKRKLEESKMGWADYHNSHFLSWKPEDDDANLYESIQKKGIQKPVELYLSKEDGKFQPEILDGNHRTAVANDINPNMYVPVSYNDFRIKD